MSDFSKNNDIIKQKIKTHHMETNRSVTIQIDL